ncbi:MAG TPA: hypothetical protein VH208_08235 [Myxococcaceae bacterium]|nr:hypothetical protein [Myxococcaceae bacterium]
MRIARAFCFTLPLLLSSLSAHAATVVVDRAGPSAQPVVGAFFDADLSRGIAWVVVDFLEQGGEEDLIHSERLPVPGLTYDAASRTIHLADGERNVTCAVGKRLLWATRFQPTSDCPIRVQQGSEVRFYGAAKSEPGQLVVEVGTAR